ncbi:hypothetical protein [Spiroplasma endosymbiont of Virgichneumon dumeticola]|uniref:hypothetical protein n=1 Tax=Spiroplasma endosymbiont of Virgichneumon dumeticola TaxID=3139323 RepID=UPI0035C90061
MSGKRERVNIPSGGTIPELNITDNTAMYLGFQNLDNNRLSFKMQLFPIYLYVCLIAYNSSNNVQKYTTRLTIKIKLTISKIVLNAK